MSLKDFQILKKLGEGSYSSVYQVKRVSDGEIYALKKVKMQELTEKERVNALNEIRILASINHPNIVQYKEAFIEDSTSTLCLVMEFAQNGDLYAEIVKCQKNSSFADEEWVWRILIQMVRGLKALHSLKILHRDIKSANIFLSDEKLTAKLGDMNVSKVAKKGLLYTQTGTPYYASPEVWRDMPYDHKSDIWSLGCVLYELIALKPPFRSETMEGLFKKILAGKYPRIPQQFSQDMGKIIRSMLQVQPHLRPNCDKILELPIVHQRVIKYFPEAVPLNQYDNILLRTIKMPKNLLYLTDQLPSATYNTGRGAGLKFPEANKKNNTQNIGSERQKEIDKGKRFRSLQRGQKEQNKQSDQNLNQSEILHHKRPYFQESDEDQEDYEEDFDQDQDIQDYKISKIQTRNLKAKDEDIDRKQVLDQIIDTTKKIDKQLQILQDHESRPEDIEKVKYQKVRKIKKKIIRNDLNHSYNEGDAGIESGLLKPNIKRVIMQEGVYDKSTMEEPTRYEKLLQQAIGMNGMQNINGNYHNYGITESNQGVIQGRSHSVAPSQKAQLSRIFRDNSQDNSLERKAPSVLLPQIFSDKSQNTGKRNPQSHNYLKLQHQTMDYQNQDQNSSSLIQPSSSDRYLHYLNKPSVGLNQDRFNAMTNQQSQFSIQDNRQRNLLQNQQRNLIPSAYMPNMQSNANLNHSILGLQNNQQYDYSNRMQQQQYGQLSNMGIKSQRQHQIVNLGSGNKVDYFSRMYPQF